MPLEEKHKDLKSTRQREIIDHVIQRLAKEHPDYYYMPTIELAAQIQAFIREPGKLMTEDQQLVAAMSRRDIQLMLGLQSP